MKQQTKARIASLLMAGAMMVTAAMPTMANAKPATVSHKFSISAPDFFTRSNPNSSKIYNLQGSAHGSKGFLLETAKEAVTVTAKKVEETLTGVTAYAETVKSSGEYQAVPKIAMGNVKEEIAHTISNAISSLDYASNSNQATWYKITDVIPVTR